MAIELNWDHWPLRIESIVGSPTKEEITGYLSRVEELNRICEGQVILFDCRFTKVPKSSVLSIITRHIRQEYDQIEKSIAIGILLVSSPVVRVVLNTIFAMTPSPSPMRIVASIDQVIKELAPLSEKYGFEFQESTLRALLAQKHDPAPGIHTTGKAPDGKTI